MSRESIFKEISEERDRQDKLHPNQHIPIVDRTLLERSGGCTEQRMAEEYEIPTQDRAKFITDEMSRRGEVTWAHVLIEELCELVGDAVSGDPRLVRKEAIQLAACCVRLVECLDDGNIDHGDYPCQICRDFADNFNPRTRPTFEAPFHPDCPKHQGVL